MGIPDTYLLHSFALDSVEDVSVALNKLSKDGWEPILCAATINSRNDRMLHYTFKFKRSTVQVEIS